MTPEETIEYLGSALAEVERRLREETLPLVEAINVLQASDLITDEQKRAIKNAWQWAVYGSGVHAQIALTVIPKKAE